MLLFYTTAINQMEKVYEEERTSIYMNSANIIASYITDENQFIDTTEKRLLETQMREKSREGGYRVLLLNNDGYVISDTNNEAIGTILVFQEGMTAIGGEDLVTVHKDEEAIYAAASIIIDNGDNIGAVLVVGSITDIYSLIEEMENTIILYAALFSIFIVILVLFFSKFLLAPFGGILEVLEKMTDGNLDVRMEDNRSDEFGEISKAFNKMAEKLQHGEKGRDEFVSNVSHELKTPLSSIKVLSESILLEENVPEEMYIEFLQDINSEVDRMTMIVNDLLTLVKLDQKEQGINIGDVQLEKLIGSLVRRLKALADKKGLILEYYYENDIVIQADETKLSLAISNLIENGIKYTESGMVKVTLENDSQNVFITVEDTGLGIPADELDKIFTRFYRVDKMRVRENGGTGLGLAITHSTILMHKGSIRVTSVEGEGSKFLVRLPIK